MTTNIPLIRYFIKPLIVLNIFELVCSYIIVTMFVICSYLTCSRINTPALVTFSRFGTTYNEDVKHKKENSSFHGTIFVNKSKGF